MYEALATCEPPRFGGVFYGTGASDIASGVMRAAKDVGLGKGMLTMRAYAEVIERARAAAAAL
ncbi:MAG TPA: hypothetical protein VIJ51_11000 [Solirubrobacteraceae bacterium]